MSEEKQQDKPLNLYQKISSVMQEVDYLQKDDEIKAGKGTYKAVSEEKVTSAVRAALVKHGLVILPVEQDHRREDTVITDQYGKQSVQRLSTVDTKYKIVDIDTEKFEILVSSGTGVDTQDKGVGKAMTYSYKYLLLRSFAIPTGEDPDKISSAELDAKQNSSKQDQPKQEQNNYNNDKPKQNANSNTNYSGGGVAGEKQIKYVHSLVSQVAKKYNIEKENVIETLRTNVGQFETVDTMTSKLASAAIKDLQAALA